MNYVEPIMIRFAEMADRAAADVIHRVAFPEDKTYSYANNIGLPGTANLVAVRGDQVVGFVSALVNGPNPNGRCLWERMRPYIGFVGVSEKYRGSSVGRTLVLEVSRLALRITGRSCIYLECEIENEGAQKFYEKLGFKTVSSEEIERTFGRPPHTRSVVYRGESFCLNPAEPVRQKKIFCN